MNRIPKGRTRHYIPQIMTQKNYLRDNQNFVKNNHSIKIITERNFGKDITNTLKNNEQISQYNSTIRINNINRKTIGI